MRIIPCTSSGRRTKAMVILRISLVSPASSDALPIFSTCSIWVSRMRFTNSPRRRKTKWWPRVVSASCEPRVTAINSPSRPRNSGSTRSEVSTVAIRRMLIKAIKPIPSAALSRLRAITPRNGQRYWRQTRERSSITGYPEKQNSQQFKRLAGDIKNNSYFNRRDGPPAER